MPTTQIEWPAHKIGALSLTNYVKTWATGSGANLTDADLDVLVGLTAKTLSDEATETVSGSGRIDVTCDGPIFVDCDLPADEIIDIIVTSLMNIDLFALCGD